MSSADLIKWNNRYKKKIQMQKKQQVAKWLLDHQDWLHSQPKGKALDLACGLGKNSFFLAEKGFEVDAWDISDVAIKFIEDKIGPLKINPWIVDLDELELPENTYEVILDFYFLDRRLIPKMKKALKPGGLIFFETWSLLEGDSKNQKTVPRYYLSEGELSQVFCDFRILDYKEQKPSVKGKAAIVARKPD